MLKIMSCINIVDRSGAKTAKVVQLAAGTGSHLYAMVSDRVRALLKTVRYFKRKRRITHKRRRGLFYGVKRYTYVVRTRYMIPYCDSAVLYFKENAGILLRKKKVFRTKKTLGITTRYVWYKILAHKFRIHF